MTAFDWTYTIDSIREFIFIVQTPSGQGTGFLAPSMPGSPFNCLITAWHVVEHAQEWREPIKLIHFSSNTEIFLDNNSRNLKWRLDRDIAIIEFKYTRPPLPNISIDLLPEGLRLKEGYQIGWLGFPSVAISNLCFFCGHVSSWIDAQEAYLVDGVAINGVSGGPAFILDEKGKTSIIGLVTEYHPNYSQGTALPGVSLVRAINPILRYFSDIKKHSEEVVAKLKDKISITTIPGPASEAGGPEKSPQE